MNGVGFSQLTQTNTEIDCATGVETIRPLTDGEMAQRELDIARAEADRAVKEAEAAVKSAEREALASWLLSRSDMTDAARAAILRALGVAETQATVGTPIAP